MKAEFEEKQFESPLNAELANVSGLFIPTGQMLESLVGFDAALLTHDTRFWRYFSYATPLGGAAIDHNWWGLSARQIHALPRFRFNLFIQHKRPIYCKGSRSMHRKHFGGPYYKFEVTPHQQVALGRLAVGTAGSAIVSYASPALHTMNALFNHIQARSLVEVTNFVEVTKLNGHRFYNYNSGGANGLANSEPTEISDESISIRIEKMRGSSDKFESNVDFIEETARLVERVGREVPILGRIYSQMLDSYHIEQIDPVSAAVIKIQTFNFLTGCSWSIAF